LAIWCTPLCIRCKLSRQKPNQSLHLTGRAMTVSQEVKVQAAPPRR